jgi:hypothetical protein
MVIVSGERGSKGGREVSLRLSPSLKFNSFGNFASFAVFIADTPLRRLYARTVNTESSDDDKLFARTQVPECESYRLYRVRGRDMCMRQRERANEGDDM